MSQRIKRNWQGETAVCIGGGPSLSVGDIKYAKDLARVIAINNAYQLAPWADMLYACDLKWWQWHEGSPGFKGERWTSDEEAAEIYGLNYIKGIHADGLSDDPALIHYGKNSGFQAINIAYLKGASRVLLLGYDMKVSGNGLSHWFGDHPDMIRSSYQSWLKYFELAAMENKIEIINCTPDSALNSFKKMDIRDAL